MVAFVTNSLNIRRNSVCFSIFECFPKFNHNFSLWFFCNQIRKNQRQKLIHQFSGGIPFKLISPIFIMFTSIFRVKVSTKCLMDPIHKLLVCIDNLKSRKIINRSIIFSNININGSFSVDYSSKIYKLFYSPHYEIPFKGLYHKSGLYVTVNDLAKRLLREMQKSELVTKALEGRSKNQLRQMYCKIVQLVTKVTERTNDAWIINLRMTLSL